MNIKQQLQFKELLNYQYPQLSLLWLILMLSPNANLSHQSHLLYLCFFTYLTNISLTLFMPFPMFLHLNVADTLLQPSYELTRNAERTSKKRKWDRETVRQWDRERDRDRDCFMAQVQGGCSLPRLMRGRPGSRVAFTGLWRCLSARAIVVVAPGEGGARWCKWQGLQWQAVANRNGKWEWGMETLPVDRQWWPRQRHNGSGASVAEVNKPWRRRSPRCISLVG